MSEQAKIGIAVKWVLKTDLEREPLVREYVVAIGSWDFVVIDNDLIFRVEMDEHRRIKGCSLLRDRDLSRKATHTFNEALHMAKDVSSDPSKHSRSQRK
jgi:hypothetical protein